MVDFHRPGHKFNNSKEIYNCVATYTYIHLHTCNGCSDSRNILSTNTGNHTTTVSYTLNNTDYCYWSRANDSVSITNNSYMTAWLRYN